MSEALVQQIQAVMFLTASMFHLLVWLRNMALRASLWFGLATLAAAGMLGARLALAPEPAAAAALALGSVCIWLVAVAWFVVDYAAGDLLRRRLAAGLSLLLAAALLAYESAAPLMRWILLATSALTLALALDGGWRLLRGLHRARAFTVGGALGLAILALGAQVALTPDDETLAPRPLLFLVAVGMTVYELAGIVASTPAALQRQRRELAHASRLAVVGQLTASIAHEINQPLGAILSNADAGEILLERPDPPLDELGSILADIRRDGLRASEVIRHVRGLARKPDLEQETLDANELVVGVVALLDADAQRRRIPLQLSMAPGPAWVRVDRAQMQQVLINLVLNAMDAIEAMQARDGTGYVAPPIRLGVSCDAHGEVQFAVADAGTGIPSEQIDQLFDSFYTSKPHGMGLGLSIARSIVEAHGGRIRARNNTGAGATFVVTLPTEAGI